MRKTLRYVLIILGLVVLGSAIALQLSIQRLAPRAKGRVISALEERFDADVQLQNLSISLFPTPTVQGDGLEIRHKGWTDPHPLIRIRHFLARAGFLAVVFDRNKVGFVRLDGLEIHLPPRGRSAFLTAGKEQDQEVASGEPGQDKTRLRFLIDRIEADGTLLEIEPKVPGKDPLQFQIASLTMKSVGPGQPMAFETQLTNAKPPGLIQSSGTFGPWQKDDPRSTAVSGDYTFQNADLSVFKGISGTLASQGKYHGTLQHIEVDGRTDTPNFALKRGGEPIHLTTAFHSIVNGTDGDTILQPVVANFQHSQFVCQGSVARKPGDSAKTVSLQASTNKARIEDVLLLVVGQHNALLRGAMNFQSKILIPPGKEDVVNKLNLDGQFSILSAKFTSSKLQQRLNVLSARARGITAEDEPQPSETAASNFRGKFKLSNGQIAFSGLSFEVPGSQVFLTGGYNIDSQKIDMQGVFRMVATLSQTQSGIKHLLLKPLDPLFRKDGAGFEVPIFIGGDRDHPELGVEVFHKEFHFK